ncbi:hypothetical protein [Streptomyces sp. NPDC056683]
MRKVVKDPKAHKEMLELLVQRVKLELLEQPGELDHKVCKVFKGLLEYRE